LWVLGWGVGGDGGEGVGSRVKVEEKYIESFSWKR